MHHFTKKILGVLLIFAILKLLNVFGKDNDQLNDVTLWKGLLIGAVIGIFLRVNWYWWRNNSNPNNTLNEMG